MAKLTFSGGIHPHDGKELTKEKPIREILPKRDLVYPLLQHIGSQAVPIVKKGDYVLAGQKIAEPDGVVSAAVHTSVSGTVKELSHKKMMSGESVMCITIENDEKYDEVLYLGLGSMKQIATFGKVDIIQKVKEAGIVGMGGAGFPLQCKLSPEKPEKIDYVIANCAECEPYQTADYRSIVEEPEKLLGGLRIVLQLFEKARGIIAIEDNKHDCIALLKKMTKDDDRISIKVLKTKYPQGSERQLIYATTGRAIHSAMHPADVGCIVNNAQTLIAVYHAVILGIPSIQRTITISGDAIRKPRNFRVKIGTDLRDVVEAAGDFSKPVSKLIEGGPMMGECLVSLETPVTKVTSMILAFSKDEISKWEPSACINCGRCVEICPGRIVPKKVAEYANHHQESEFLKHEGMECCECGCCSFVCPAKRPLTQSIKSMRRILLAKKEEDRQ